MMICQLENSYSIIWTIVLRPDGNFYHDQNQLSLSDVLTIIKGYKEHCPLGLVFYMGFEE